MSGVPWWRVASLALLVIAVAMEAFSPSPAEPGMSAMEIRDRTALRTTASLTATVMFLIVIWSEP